MSDRGDRCPVCGARDTDLLSTTNEWKYWCPLGDIRFNDRGELRPGDVHKETSHE